MFYLDDKGHSQMVVPAHVAGKQPIARVVRMEPDDGESAVWDTDCVLEGRIHKVARDNALRVHLHHLGLEQPVT